MPAPASMPEIKKPQSRVERPVAAETVKKANVRPRVAELIKKVLNENAPTWKELAKR